MALRDYPALEIHSCPLLVDLALLVYQGLSPRVSTELLCSASADAHDEALQGKHYTTACLKGRPRCVNRRQHRATAIEAHSDAALTSTVDLRIEFALNRTQKPKLSIPLTEKAGGGGRKPAWLSKEVLGKPRAKKGAYGLWQGGRVQGCCLELQTWDEESQGTGRTELGGGCYKH